MRDISIDILNIDNNNYLLLIINYHKYKTTYQKFSEIKININCLEMYLTELHYVDQMISQMSFGIKSIKSV